MRLRNVAAAVAGGVGLTALANRALRTEELDAPLPGQEGTYRWRGMDIAYTEAGDPDAPDVLLLHGVNAAGSSHEFREVFDDLAEDYHVIAPDFPGFGRSDRPPLLYSAGLYESFVRDFAADMTEEATCIASSLSAAYAVAAHEEVGFSELVLVCPTGSTMPERRPMVRTLLRTPLVGEGVYNLIASKPSLRYFSADHGYHDPSNVADETVDYHHRTSHQPGARFAPASFMAGYLDPEWDLREKLAAVDVPVTLVWGREATTTPLDEGRELAEIADARLVVIDYADLLPHVEHPEKFVEAIEGSLPRAKTE